MIPLLFIFLNEFFFLCIYSDVHLTLEKEIASFFGTENSINYAQGFSTISSVIPAFAKRGDLIIAYVIIFFCILFLNTFFQGGKKKENLNVLSVVEIFKILNNFNTLCPLLTMR